MTPFFEWLDSVPLWIYLGGFLTASAVLLALDVRLRRRAAKAAPPSEVHPRHVAPTLRIERIAPPPMGDSARPRRQTPTRLVS